MAADLTSNIWNMHLQHFACLFLLCQPKPTNSQLVNVSKAAKYHYHQSAFIRPLLVFTCTVLVQHVLLIGGSHVATSRYTLHLTHDCSAKFEFNHIIRCAEDTTVVGLISNNDETSYREEVEQLASSHKL